MSTVGSCLFRRGNSGGGGPSRKAFTAFPFLLIGQVWLSSAGVASEMGRDWYQATAAAGWSQRYLFGSAVHDDKIWVLGGYGLTSKYTNDVWSSTSGSVWTRVTTAAQWGVRCAHAAVEHDGYLYVLGGVMSRPPNYLPERYSDTWRSLDGVTWERIGTTTFWSARAYPAVVSFNGRIWVLGGQDASNESLGLNDIWSSTDGAAWTKVNAQGHWSRRMGHRAVVFDGYIWVLGGRSGMTAYRDVWRSADGLNWEQVTSAAPWAARHSHTLLAQEGRLWVIAGGNASNYAFNDVWVSPDGLHWLIAKSSSPWAKRFWHGSVAYGDALWVFGGSDQAGFNDVWYSVGTVAGDNWRAVVERSPWSSRRGLSAAALGDSLFVIGGNDATGSTHDVWKTSNGTEWEPATAAAPWSARSGHAAAVFSDKLWLVGGAAPGSNGGGAKAARTLAAQPPNYLADVWSSLDGSTWEPTQGTVPWDGRCSHTLTVFNDRLWMMGGFTNTGTDRFLNDVWSTGDGETWTSATLSAPWSPRAAHTAAALNGKIWVLGGYGSGGPAASFRDVWCSEDGITWKQAAASATWPARFNHATVSYAGNMWVIGGTASNGSLLPDAWYSPNGSFWVQAIDSAPWQGRTGHAAAVFKNKIYVLGGQGALDLQSDVWTTNVPMAESTGYLLR